MGTERQGGVDNLPQYEQQRSTSPLTFNGSEDVPETPYTPLRRNRPLIYKKHRTRRFTYLDAGFIVNGVGSYIFDLVTDVLACIKYFSTGDFWWAVLTTVFILVASITVQAASFRWFIDDYTREAAGNKHNKPRKLLQRFCSKIVSWLIWIIVHVLQLATINR